MRYGQPKRLTANGLISANGVSPVIISASRRPVAGPERQPVMLMAEIEPQAGVARRLPITGKYTEDRAARALPGFGVDRISQRKQRARSRQRLA